MTFGSLFAGIGGFDLGFERAGMECAWQVEIDPYCQKVLEKHWPSVRRHDDIKTFPPTNPDEWRCDIICGGFPCQPFSVAGKRKGKSDERWLWPEFERTIREIRPEYVVIENVPGFIRVGLDDVLCGLAEAGFDVEWFVIPASAVGAPHKRERLFVIANNWGYRMEGLCKGPIHRFKEFQRFQDVGGVAEIANRPDIHPPLFCGASDGIPCWVDRLRGLGNAVVPQVAEWIGREIIKMEDSPRA